MDPLNLTIDFTGVSAASGGLGILSPGLHTGTIAEFQFFEDSGRLYAYIITDGIRHRESFNVTNPKSFSFIKSFCMSAGLPEAKLTGEIDLPFHKLCGQKVYFNYTPPQLDENGKAQTGSYPRYAFYPKNRYEQMASSMRGAVGEHVVLQDEIEWGPKARRQIIRRWFRFPPSRQSIVLV